MAQQPSRADEELKPIGASAIHLCIDMQRLFSGGEWEAPWMQRVLPVVLRITRAKPAQTVFTRFVPPENPEQVEGQWRPFFERWRALCTDRLDPRMLDLLPELAAFEAQAIVIDKRAYSPFFETDLASHLETRGIDTVVISGAETDVCVLAAVMDAVDLGLRVVLARDALCSANDETHDALMKLYTQRFANQVELADSQAILAAWG